MGGDGRDNKGHRTTELTKTVRLSSRTHGVLLRLKASKGFRTFEELIQDMVRVYVGLADPDGARRAYVELVRRACRELGPDAAFYPRLLLKRYGGEVSKELEEYILSRQDEEVFCFLFFKNEEED